MENQKIETIETKESRIRLGRLFSLAAMIGVMLTFFSIGAFAAETPDEQIINGVSSGLGKAFKIIRHLVIPTAALYIGIMAFKGFTGKDGGNDIKKGIIIAVVAIVLVSIAPVLARAISGWTTSDGTGVFSNVDVTVTGVN